MEVRWEVLDVVHTDVLLLRATLVQPVAGVALVKRVVYGMWKWAIMCS